MARLVGHRIFKSEGKKEESGGAEVRRREGGVAIRLGRIGFNKDREGVVEKI